MYTVLRDHVLRRGHHLHALTLLRQPELARLEPQRARVQVAAMRPGPGAVWHHVITRSTPNTASRTVIRR